VKIAIASGKGGTGKTTVAVNLALVAADGGGREIRLLDCDVEEPNAHIFVEPGISARETVAVPVPRVDESECSACGECGKLCEYSAIVTLGGKPLVFPELCHGCGGCALVCPQEAISEVPREAGCIEIGRAGELDFIGGRLRVGEAMSPPVIRAVKRRGGPGGLVILDAPPGTSCPVIAAIRDCDYVILVTEPTPFGMHDLALAVETVRRLGQRFGVVVNRSDIGDDRALRYCAEQGIEVLAEIPDDRRIAEAYSRGEPMVRALPEYAQLFSGMLESVTGGPRP
jgi:MinD superfamily P-loop ATPase